MICKCKMKEVMVKRQTAEASWMDKIKFSTFICNTESPSPIEATVENQEMVPCI